MGVVEDPVWISAACAKRLVPVHGDRNARDEIFEGPHRLGADRCVRVLAPVLERCGMPPETTADNLRGRITVEQWRAEASKHSKATQEMFDELVKLGADPAILNGYVDGTRSHSEMMAEMDKCMREGLAEVFRGLGHEPPKKIITGLEQYRDPTAK
jgi:hypothetical protein